MATEFARASAIIDHLYGAALDETQWTGVLAEINQFLNGTGAALFFVRGTHCHEASYTANLDPHLFEEYAAHYFTSDPKVKVAFGSQVNRIITDLQVIEESKMDSCEFYADLMARYDLRYCLATAVSVEADYFGVVTSLRGRRPGSPGLAEQRRLALLVPHFRRALQLRTRRLATEAERHGLLDALGMLDQGVVLVGHRAELVWANRTAEAILARQDGIHARRQRLRTADISSTNELMRLIADAASAASSPLVRPGGVLAVERPSMRRPYQVLVTPLPSATRFAHLLPGIAPLPVAAVFISDPERPTASPIGHLARLHGLTPAEARLAGAVADGTSLQDYAEEHRLSVNYVRWLLKQVQGKTATRSLADLTRLLTRGIPGPLPAS